MTKIKNIFWGNRHYNEEKIEIDLDNGKTIKIKLGEELNKIINKFEKNG